MRLFALVCIALALGAESALAVETVTIVTTREVERQIPKTVLKVDTKYVLTQFSITIPKGWLTEIWTGYSADGVNFDVMFMANSLGLAPEKAKNKDAVKKELKRHGIADLTIVAGGSRDGMDLEDMLKKMQERGKSDDKMKRAEFMTFGNARWLVNVEQDEYFQTKWQAFAKEKLPKYTYLWMATVAAKSVPGHNFESDVERILSSLSVTKPDQR